MSKIRDLLIQLKCFDCIASISKRNEVIAFIELSPVENQILSKVVRDYFDIFTTCLVTSFVLFLFYGTFPIQTRP